jgi:hypothetical protein
MADRGQAERRAEEVVFRSRMKSVARLWTGCTLWFGGTGGVGTWRGAPDEEETVRDTKLKRTRFLLSPRRLVFGRVLVGAERAAIEDAGEVGHDVGGSGAASRM